MFEIDKAIAQRTLVGLPLSDSTRRFADWWLSQVTADGRPVACAVPLSGDLAASTLICEVRPWSTVLCQSSGDNVNRALGISLSGRDLLALVLPAHRPVRLSRCVKVAAGGMQFSYRPMVAADGSNHLIQGIMFPHPDRAVVPLEPSATMIIAYGDFNALEAGTRVLVSQGALDLVDEPLMFDLRPTLALAVN